MVCPKKLLEGNPNLSLFDIIVQLGITKQRTSNNPSFFFNHYRISKRTFKIPSFLLGHHIWIQKTEIFYNNKNSYAPIMELTTHLLKKKIYNQIKILYPLWGVQPNLENQKTYDISITVNQSKYIDLFD